MQPIINTGLSLALLIAIPALAVFTPASFAQTSSPATANSPESANRSDADPPSESAASTSRLLGAARPLDFIQRITAGKQAEAQWRQTIERSPKNAEAYRNLAKALTEQNRYRDAEAIYQRAIQLDPANEASYLAFGQFLQTQTRPYEAASLYQQMVEALPNSAIAHEQFASSLMRVPEEEWPNRDADIEAAYRQSIALNPNQTAPYYGLGAHLTRQQRFAESMATMRKIIQIDPNNNRIYATLAAIPTGNQDPAAATAIYREGLAQQPNNYALYVNFANWLLSNNQNAEAEAVYQTAIEQIPEQTSLNLMLADYLTATGRLAEAEAQYRAAIEKDIRRGNAEDALPYLRFGDFLAQQGRTLEAKAAYETAILRSPEVNTYSRLGALLETTEGSEATIALYQQAIEKPRVEDKGYFYNQIGQLLQESGQTEAAIATYRQALSVTDDASSARPLASLLIAQQQYDEALSLYQRFRATFSNDPDAIQNWKTALRRLGKGAEAEALEQTLQIRLAADAASLYQKAIAISPESGQFYSLLGDALLQQNKAIEAETAYEEAVRLNYDVFRTQIKLGQALFQQGKVEQAESTYQQALDRSPQKDLQYFTRDRSQLYQHLGALYETTNRPQLALEFYQNVLTIDPYETSIKDKIAELSLKISGGNITTTTASTEDAESMLPQTRE